MPATVPFFSTHASGGLVCAADQLAAAAGIRVLDQGGSAADAAVAAGAAMAVVAPHTCGMGGDVLAMVKAPGQPPQALLGVGRAGSGADADRLRAEGHADMPYRGDVRTVPVPGAVDGWLALHQRFGRLPLEQVLGPAIRLARDGFVPSITLVFASHLVAGLPGTDELCPGGPVEDGSIVRLPRVAATFHALARDGRAGVFQGVFGAELLALGNGEYHESDLETPLARWEEPLRLDAFGHQLWTIPPPSQGYLTLAGCWLAERLGVPDDPTDPRWPIVLTAAAVAAGRDRPEVLFDGADGSALLDPDRLARLSDQQRDRAVSDGVRQSPEPLGTSPSGPSTHPSSSDGDTTHLCVVDGEGMGVSMTQSNALDFGSHLVAGASGVFLHNRGIGFSLVPGHPAEYAPGRRPSHTLSPALVTRHDGSLSHVIGTMGGDSQPQIVQQLLIRLLHIGQDPAEAIAAARVVLDTNESAPFRLWTRANFGTLVEGHAPKSWIPSLEEHGERVRQVGPYNPVDVGCSQIIAVSPGDDGVVLSGASDPRSPEGAALGR